MWPFASASSESHILHAVAGLGFRRPFLRRQGVLPEIKDQSCSFGGGASKQGLLHIGGYVEVPALWPSSHNLGHSPLQ